MAKSISEEELQLKKRARRRLIGAVALVAAVVIFLPMVLDSEPKPANHDITVKIPSPDSDNFISKIVPLGAPAPQPVSPPAASSPAAVDNPPPAAPAVTPAPAAPPAPAPPPAKSEPAPKPAAKPETKKSAPAPKAVEKSQSAPTSKTNEKSAGNFVVQVAALNDAAKAKQMEQQLAGAGIKAYTEGVPTTKGKVTRVRVGPFKTREEAEKMRDKLKSIGLSGNIVPQ